MNDAGPRDESSGGNERRPLVERAGLVVMAGILAAVFAALAIAAWGGGEIFLAVMSGIGAVMTIWAAGSTLRRG